ncbi:uncharacterized protein IUM83_10595 [Phytophthora cinnamomi]|uniref:uncharacterized protein n=1 Tax=Phytophthora cinnamomi TaxID=4785 RepID=UPI00355975FB|nr:hypothetical protein IUM83_10595 [Phytophthora cinnamomi]
MLSFPVGATGRRLRLGPAPSRGDAWRRRNPAVTTTTTLIDLKQQQLVAAQQGAAGPSPVDVDTLPQPEEFPLLQAPALRRRGIRTAFRLMTFSDEDEDSDYEPSQGEEEGERGSEVEEEEKEEGDDPSAEELFESYHQDTGTSEEEVEEVELDEDLRWWKSGEDKRRWEKRYRQADAAFRKRFGCAIDTPAQPETRRRLRREKNRHRAYKLVLAGLVVAYLVQLAVVYSASSWAFSMVAWRTSTTEESDDTRVNLSDGKVIDETRGRSAPAVLPSEQQVPEHVRTGLHLCATLSRRVVKSEHDVTATQHALRACDIAVKFAPLKSREGIEAHVLRGDLRSLLARFDGADEDYKDALTLVLEVESSSIDSKLAPALSQELDLKLVANRWTQLYKTKGFKELRREAKARTADNNDASAIRELAADWLSAFKQKKPVLEVLTLQRSWTLRRLKYEALDDENEATSSVR